MDDNIKTILAFLHTTRGLDFSASRYSSLERKINQRLLETSISSAKSYIEYLETSPEEMVCLIDLLTVNVSQFFRNPLTFETLAKRVLPELISRQKKETSPTIRVWSAGCASGEEAYSVAILIHELLRKEPMPFDVKIFATDINRSILETAQKGLFIEAQLFNVKLGLLNKYFTKNKDHFSLDKRIKKMITFSYYDIIDPKTYVPPESVFGNFDLVLCRNLLIYFKKNRQSIIFKKLFRSLAALGTLVLGEAELLPQEYKNQFSTDTEHCHIYRKLT